MTTTVINKFRNFFNQQTAILPLAIFRMAFGFLMCFSLFRFMFNGWIEDCYITPVHFTYQYFDWIKPFDITTMYIIVSICGISALCIGLGFLYRLATIIFFLSFTYLELIEKSWYLNHYYFVSLVAFLLILVPANRNYALDANIFPKIKRSTVPYWTVAIFKLQLCIVYFFGGLAKLKSDWLIHAQPLKIWLKAKTDLPLIGWLFNYDITPYIFSWTGMIYDLTIPFLLWSKRSRPMAYLFVIVFHVLTYTLFNIGMFPWLMMLGSLVFITAEEWQNIFRSIGIRISETHQKTIYTSKKLIPLFLITFFAFQIIFPLRHYVLSNNVLWTENGFRFAWHVMVMEKNGFATFTVIDNKTGKRWIEYPKTILTEIQEKQMSFQPDMIWQFAQLLRNEYAKKGIENCSIYVDCRVSLNGRTSQPFINPEIDLAKVPCVDDIYNFVLPL